MNPLAAPESARGPHAAGGRLEAPLSRSLGFEPSVVEVGFGHPAMRRVFERLGGSAGYVLTLEDDRIVSLEVEVGEGHRGFELEAERHGFSGALPYVRRLGSGSGWQHATAYCLAVEKLAGIELPDRALWLRTLACELERVFDHFLRLSAVAASVALPAAEAMADRALLRLSRWLANALAGEPGAGWIGLGGVASPLPSDFAAGWREMKAELMGALVAYERVALASSSCVRRLAEVARLSAETAERWSVTGPALRAAGIAADLRKDAPYLAYGSVDFEVPIAEEGDALSRALVVLAEIRQSLGIVDQSLGWLQELGPGAVASRALDEEPVVRQGQQSVAIESSAGQLGFRVVSDGEGPPRRVHCRAPSFFHAHALAPMLAGARVDDLLPAAASMFLLMPECDR